MVKFVLLFFFDHLRIAMKQYIDVWPINFLNPGENDAFDNTSLFMMQLACIVNMVPIWNKLKLRVCVCNESKTTYFTLNSTTQTHSEKLNNLLKELRIFAELYPINGWNNVIEKHGNDMETYFQRFFKQNYFLKLVLIVIL